MPFTDKLAKKFDAAETDADRIEKGFAVVTMNCAKLINETSLAMSANIDDAISNTMTGAALLVAVIIKDLIAKEFGEAEIDSLAAYTKEKLRDLYDLDEALDETKAEEEADLSHKNLGQSRH
jgi:hypothetical protein